MSVFDRTCVHTELRAYILNRILRTEGGDDDDDVLDIGLSWISDNDDSGVDSDSDNDSLMALDED